MYSNDDVAYANMRLQDTIITYNGRAVLVNGVHKDYGDKPLLVESSYILNHDKVGPFMDSIDNYSLLPVNLGFVNNKLRGTKRELAAYFVREPMRNDWRQGLRKQNARCIWGLNGWDMKAIARTVEGHYPQLDQALVFSEDADKGYGVAWCRDFCVGHGLDIYYRSYGKVGNFVKDTKEFLLDREFFWVEESLKEAI